MLACLALDAACARLSQHWWWQPLLRLQQQNPIQAAMNIWRAQAQAVPAAVHYLHTWRHTSTVMPAVPADAAHALLQALGQAFALPYLHAGLATGAGGESTASFWLQQLPDLVAPAHVAKSQLALLGTALLLHREPHVLRQPGFIRRYQQWITGSTTGRAANLTSQESGSQPTRSAFSETEPAPSSSPTGGVEPSVLSQATPDNGQIGGESPLAPAAESVPATAAEGTSIERPRLSAGKNTATSAAGDRRTPVVATIATDAGDNGRHTAKAHLALPATPLQASETNGEPAGEPGHYGNETEAETANPLFGEAGVKTRLAGILFLIPLLQHLRLLVAENNPFPVMFALSAWRWLTLIARALLAERHSDFDADPIWRELDSLAGAGRDGTGAFAEAAAYLLPDAWLTPAAHIEGSWRWRLQRTRLQVRHPAGFLAADVRCNADEAPLRLRELQQRWACDLVPEAPAPDGASSLAEATRPEGRTSDFSPLDRWLHFLVPYLRWRLAVALRLPADDTPALAAKLLLRNGEVFVSTTHVDVLLPLDDVDLDIRMAGLDCTPGWQPIFGRVITFHYV